MYDRYQQWKDAEIASQAESLWTNTIVSGSASVDFRIKLRGYGWVKDGDDALPVLYEGRYQCYFREAGDTTWTRFATVVSERETSGESRVYKDTFVELGKSDELVYEFKVVAADAAKFTAYSGGSLENIAADEQLWYDAKMRLGEPNSAIPDELIFVAESVTLAPDILYLEVTEFVVVEELVTWGVYYPVPVDEVLTVTEFFAGEVVLILEASETVSVVEDFETWQDWVNVGTPVEEVPVVEDVALVLDELHLSVYESPWVWEIVALAYDILDVAVSDEVTVSEELASWTEPPWRIPATEDITVEDLVGLDVVDLLYEDDCSSVSGWNDQSTGTGSFVSDSGSFLITGDGLDNVGQRTRTTGVNLQRYYSLKFKYKIVGDDGSLVITVGSDRLRFRFTLYQNQGASGSLALNSGDWWFNLFDARSNWVEFELRVLEECEDGEGLLVDVYIDGDWAARGFADTRRSGSVSNGQIQIATTGTTDGSGRIDDIELLLLEQGNIRYVWHRDNDTSLTTDITVEENVALVPFILPQNIGVYDTVSVTESADLAGLFLVDKFETLFVLEDVQLQQDIIFLSAQEDVSVTEADVVIPEIDDIVGVDLLSIVENIDLEVPIDVSVFEDLTGTVDESVNMFMEFLLEIDDTVTVVENFAALFDTLAVEFFDEITVTEYAATAPYWLYVSVSDDVLITETISVLDIVVEVGVVADVVGITEDVEFFWSALALQPVENVNVTEDVTMYTFSIIPMSVSEDVSVAEDVTQPTYTYPFMLEPCDDYTTNAWSKSVVGNAVADVNPAGEWRWILYGTGGYKKIEIVKTFTGFTNPALYEVKFRYKEDFTQSWVVQWYLRTEQKLYVRFDYPYITINLTLILLDIDIQDGNYHDIELRVSAAGTYESGGLLIVDVYVDGKYQGTACDETGDGGYSSAIRFNFLKEGTPPDIQQWHHDNIRVTTRREVNDVYRSMKDDVGITEAIFMTVV